MININSIPQLNSSLSYATSPTLLTLRLWARKHALLVVFYFLPVIVYVVANRASPIETLTALGTMPALHMDHAYLSTSAYQTRML